MHISSLLVIVGGNLLKASRSRVVFNFFSIVVEAYSSPYIPRKHSYNIGTVLPLRQRVNYFRSLRTFHKYLLSDLRFILRQEPDMSIRSFEA